MVREKKKKVVAKEEGPAYCQFKLIHSKSKCDDSPESGKGRGRSSKRGGTPRAPREQPPAKRARFTKTNSDLLDMSPPSAPDAPDAAYSNPMAGITKAALNKQIEAAVDAAVESAGLFPVPKPALIPPPKKPTSSAASSDFDCNTSPRKGRLSLQKPSKKNPCKIVPTLCVHVNRYYYNPFTECYVKRQKVRSVLNVPKEATLEELTQSMARVFFSEVVPNKTGTGGDVMHCDENGQPLDDFLYWVGTHKGDVLEAKLPDGTSFSLRRYKNYHEKQNLFLYLFTKPVRIVNTFCIKVTFI